MVETKAPGKLDDRLIQDVVDAIREGRRVKRKIGNQSSIHIDRQLPYLCVYRHRERFSAAEENPDWGCDQLILGESSYLVVSAGEDEERVSKLVHRIACELNKLFGVVLVLEVWSGEETSVTDDNPVQSPSFGIYHLRHQPGVDYMHTLAKQLSLVSVDNQPSKVSLTSVDQIAPPALPSLFSFDEAQELHVRHVGLEVAPIFRQTASGEHFPKLLKSLTRQLTRVLEKTFFEFLRRETTMCPPNYLALGRRSMVQAVWQVDRMLSDVADQIDFLLLVTPTNTFAAHHEFRHGLYQKAPMFLYHPAPFDPVSLKRKLYKTPVEKIEDPTLAQMFREQLDDIESRITMVAERQSPRFLLSSLKMYERPDRELVDLACELLERLEVPAAAAEADRYSPQEFAELGSKELDYYRSRCPDLNSKVEIRDDIPGVMVSAGNLLIGSQRRVLKTRANALLSHEVGTHIVTGYNGRAQRFRQMKAGLPGYDELQESLAVLGEYLVGGLSNQRVRTLAGRVLAVHWLVEGADFVEVYRKLIGEYGFIDELAFTITLRVFRSGGFTKDVVYLRGLTRLVELVKHGTQLELLYAGKFGLDYLPVIRELMLRKVLKPAALLPRFMNDPATKKRLASISASKDLMDMLARQ